MTCTLSCRKATSSGCVCADCRGRQHGVESPQLRLELAELPSGAPAETAPAVAGPPQAPREPMMLTLLGREIRVVPDVREVPDDTAPHGWRQFEVWIATGPRGRVSDVTPEAAAWAALRA